MVETSVIDQLLEHADQTFGLSVITGNPQRLHVLLNARMREHRQIHPEAYRNISIINSKSPRELYLVNRTRTQETRTAHNLARQAPAPGRSSD